jgi:hypothetical protein
MIKLNATVDAHTQEEEDALAKLQSFGFEMVVEQQKVLKYVGYISFAVILKDGRPT